MKNLILFIFIFLNTLSYSQCDSVYIIKNINEISNTSYTYTSKNILIPNLFILDVLLNNKTNIKCNYLIFKTLNNYTCDKNIKLEILLSNNKKITKHTPYNIDCEGYLYLKLTKSNINNLKNNLLSEISLKNNNNFEYFNGEILKNDKRYFIQLFYSIKRDLYFESK